LVELNAMTSRSLPDLDALYIGGGFPETQAQALADNGMFRDALNGKSIGASRLCRMRGAHLSGGTDTVCRQKLPHGRRVAPGFRFPKKPSGHGYTVLETCGQNPYYSMGKILRGHEFHYSTPVFTASKESVHFAFTVRRGHGIDGSKMVFAERMYWEPIPTSMRPVKPDGPKGLLGLRLNTKKSAKPP
jgi:cobyrinic acid a,c-diamide synthase